jgi:hypothetical protein
MAGLFGGPKLKHGSPQWRELRDSLLAFSQDLWVYLIEIEDQDWQEGRVRALVDVARKDLQRAYAAWPEGKDVMARLADLFEQSIQVREREHALVLAAPHRQPVSDPSRYHAASVKWQNSMRETERQLAQVGEKMFACCDRIKKQTGIDLRTVLETPQIPEDKLHAQADGKKMCPSCGEELDGDALTCRYCGHQFGAP